MSDFSRRDVLKLLGALPFAGCLLTGKAEAIAPAMQNADCLDTMTETRVLMGTMVTITLAQASRGQMENAMGQAFERMKSLIGIFDRFDASSPLSTLNCHGHLYDAPPELTVLLDKSQEFGALTSGAFNVTVLPVVDLFRRYQNPGGNMVIPEAELCSARALVRAQGLQIKNRDVRLERDGMGVTLDGIAKGHIADVISCFLAETGLAHHLINAGGDIVARGEKAPGRAWTVGVENPAMSAGPMGRHDYIATLPLKNRAIATSGNYQIYYDASRRHHHLVSPETGTSPVNLVSVSVLAPTAQEADALATSLSIMPPSAGLRLIASLPGRECLMLDAQGHPLFSAGWQGQDYRG